jgi:hypothetical protein
MDQRAKEESWEVQQDPRLVLDVLVPFQTSARFHDEATTSDYGGDIGDQFNISPGANEHCNKKDDW